MKDWRRRPDLNRGWRFCRPLPYLLATPPRDVRGSKRWRPREGPRLRDWVRLPPPRSAHDRSEPRWRGEPKLPREAREQGLERETGFEPATSTLARSHSTTELFPPERPK